MFWHGGNQGAQGIIDLFCSLEYLGDIRVYHSNKQAVFHASCKAIRLRLTIIKPILFCHLGGLTRFCGGRFFHSL